MSKSDDTALQIAVLIDRDPVMAAQIKTHIGEKRLLECLDLQTPAQDLAAAAMQSNLPGVDQKGAQD